MAETRNREMAKTRNRLQLSSDELTTRRRPALASPVSIRVQRLSPLWRFSPRYKGSALFDSYELQAMTRQINKAVQGSFCSMPVNQAKSPFCCKRLGHIYRENAKLRKRVSGSSGNRPTHIKTMKAVARSFAARLWKKVKKGFSWKKQDNK